MKFFTSIVVVLSTTFVYAQEQAVMPPEPTPTPSQETPPSQPQASWYDKVKFQSQFRFRFEARDNQDFLNSSNDPRSFFLTRARLLAQYQPMQDWLVVAQPQFSGTWGQVDGSINGSGLASGGSVTSGGIIDKTITMHQLYLQWQLNPKFSIKIGRQELIYGDSLLIGNADFSNVGRAFDAFRMRFEQANHKIDLFFSRIAEDDINSPNVTGDEDFAGLYWNYAPKGALKNIDTYALWLKDNRVTGPTNFHFATVGSRIKLEFSGIDLRSEGGFQAGKHIGESMLAYMYDAEAGYTIHVQNGLRFSGEYSFASGDDPNTGTFTRWHQLFPSPHPWFGYLDFFGRQNMKSAAFHATLYISDAWTTGASFHNFWRANENDYLYSINTEAIVSGQTVSTISSQKYAAQEIDYHLTYSPRQYVDFLLQGGALLPKSYVRDTIGPDFSYYAFVQSTFKF